jgi:hypothetical protein
MAVKRCFSKGLLSSNYFLVASTGYTCVDCLIYYWIMPDFVINSGIVQGTYLLMFIRRLF